ncbi:hypothetical protein ACFQ8T_12590 [Isoptericola sp. NPDC056618]|uniref:hypothetical protein n=1 Tax=Isoptericola sp. NPDC056618 TaxID=3345878 RepID=UPI003697D0BB
MPTTTWTSQAWCSACQKNVTVHWTRIHQENANGQAVVDLTEGRDEANHEFR